MKVFYPILILCIAGSITVNAQSLPKKQGLEMTVGSDPAYAQLRLTKELLELRHCSNDTLQFRVRLNFLNKGERPVMLDKHTRAISEYLVSRSVENAAKRRYEFVAHLLVTYDTADATPKESNFVLLKSGESYSIDQELQLHDQRSMRVGRHVLQIVVSNWHYLASNVEWREHWRNKGYLWTDPITSIPMPFVVQKRDLVDCQ